MLFIGTWDQCQRSGEMPVMRCDTRQGQFWMQNEAIATTSEFHIQNSSLKAKANPTNYFRSLDDEQLGPLQMADHDHAGNATNTNSGSKVNPTLVLNNNKSTVVASAAAALCDKLKNGSQTALRSTRHSDVDDDDEDESLTTSTTTSSPSSSSSSAEDSGGGNDDMDDDPDMSSAFCDDLGSCGDNDPAANNGLFDDEGDDGVEMVVDSAHVVDDQFGGGGGRCVVGQRVVTIANGPQLAGDLDDDDDEMDDEDDDDDYSGDGQLGLRRRRRRKTSEGRVELDDDEDDEMDDVDDTKDHHQETTAATTVVTLPTECHLPIAVEVVDKDQVQKSTLKNDSSPDVAATIAKGTNNNNNVNNNNNNSNNNNNNNSLTKRPNKRKNFKPRNIVYQQQYEDACDDVDNDFIDDYNTASCWDASLPGHPNSSLSIKDLDCYSENTGSPERRTMLLHPNDNCSKSSPGDVVVHLPGLPGTLDADSGVDGGGEGAGDSDQPLDLSDCATSSIGKRTSLAKSPPHQDGPCRETVDISEDRGCGGAATASMCAVPVRAASSLTLPETSGTPMDLTVSRGTPEPVRTASRDNAASSNCSAMDLSKGPPPSVHHAVPSLCSSSSTSSSSSSSTNKLLISGGSTVDQPPLPPTYATTSQQPNNVPQSCSSDPLCSILAPVVTSGSTCRVPVPSGRSSGVATAVPMVTPPSVTGLTSISASLLGLHADLMSPLASHSSASVRSAQNAAATAVAVHAAALGLTQAIRDRDEVHEGGSGGGLLLPPPMDAPTMKDYAESTVKELLGLYGINDMAESITKDVPLPNFSSVKILENLCTPMGLLSHVPSTSTSHLHSVSTPLTTSPSVVTTSSPSYSQIAHPPSSLAMTLLSSSTSSPSTVTPSSASSTNALITSSFCNDDFYESLQSQMVDSVAKLTSLPPNNIIGNPRVILPHDMSTILTLAALQKSKTHIMPSTSPPILDSSPSSRLLTSQASLGLTPGGSPLSTSLFKDGKASPVDYSRYVKRFSSSTECGHNSCKDLNYREHFHCLDCNSRVFVKKEEMIRHFKWHKKRDESLQHGFLRFSPMDDCSEKFPNCSHNRKQTHYHCLKDGCDKVYISTSDVQMHANYHRKDSAIIQEGFQRFRATEDCATPSCSFSGQRTTHFHCRRPTCNYTFKNKADMEKHKSYHIKDEQLNRDGFKKFMKHEHCMFENCRFSRVCNHIHCIRPGCSYVLHSSGQLYSHKRKHERRENEMAYRKFKLAQSMMRSLGENQVLALQSLSDELKVSEAYNNQFQPSGVSGISTSSGGLSSVPSSSTHGLTPDSTTLSFSDAMQQSFTSALLAARGSQHLDPTLAAHGLIPSTDHLTVMDFGADLLKARLDDAWKKYLSRYTANDPCKSNCEYLYKDHYHCNAENCTMVFRSKDGVREHARNHEQQDQVTEAFYNTVDVGQVNCCPADCPYQSKERHYHCGWQSCREIILASDKPFRRLDHYKMHEYSHKLTFSKEMAKDPLSLQLPSSMEGIFKRKRGRPPKNRVIEFPLPSGSSEFPQAIYTSFKLPKPNNLPMMSLNDKGFSSSIATTSTSPTISKPPSSPLTPVTSPLGHLPQNMIYPKVEMQDGFYVFPEGTPCPLQLCSLIGRHHYHCAQHRCFYVTDRSDILTLHSKDFHDNVDIMEGFVFFDRSVDCRLSGCQSNLVNRHFHCTRPNCNYSFVRYSTMSQHNDKHRDAAAIASEFSGTLVSGRFSSSSSGGGVVVGCGGSSVGGGGGGSCGSSGSNSGATVPIIGSLNSNVHKSSSPPVHVKTECPSPQATSPPGPTLSESRTPSPGCSGKPTVVKATGTYYPLSAFPQAYRNRDCGKQLSRSTSTTDVATEIEPAASASAGTLDQESCGKVVAEWQALLESHVAYSAERSCGRPSCKFKHRDHVHCTYCNQAFAKLSQFQPHIQKHLCAVSPTGNSSKLTNSEDDSSDRPDDDEDDDDGVPGAESRLHREDDVSDDSSTSSNRFPNHLRSSPSTTDSTPPSHPLAYSASFLATSAASQPPPNDLLFQTFPSVPGLPGAPTMTFLAPGSASSVEDHRYSPVHRNGNTAADFDPEHSSHDSMPESGIPSPTDSLESNSSSQFLAASNRKRAMPLPHGIRPEDSLELKKMKLGSVRILKDEPVPEGYIRYRFNEDCHYGHCGYREHQTHFHCIRTDCGYSFCDKTRFVQHTARHERLDTLMGGDFQQFRANVSCGRPHCIYSVNPGSIANKASHFHCFKCDFVCTDTNKVVAHRRQHQKLDTIMAAGFEKFTASQSCKTESCSHNQKQTHYHCLKCQYAVLGLSQMSAHKYRHLE